MLRRFRRHHTHDPISFARRQEESIFDVPTHRDHTRTQPRSRGRRGSTPGKNGPLLHAGRGDRQRLETGVNLGSTVRRMPGRRPTTPQPLRASGREETVRFHDLREVGATGVKISKTSG